MIRILVGDCLERLRELPDESVHCVVTSPPYFGLRDYGTAKWVGGDPGCEHKVGEFRRGSGMAKLGEQYRGGGHKVAEVKPVLAKNVCPHCGARREDAQIGLEETPAAYVATMVRVFREVRRVLRDDGTLWLNLGASYASGGRHPSQSRQPQRVPACDSGGTAPPDCSVPGCACRGRGGECRDGSPIHRGSSEHIDQPLARSARHAARTDRDSGPLGCSAEPPPPAGVQQSTTPSSRQNGQAAFAPPCEDEGRSTQPTWPPDAPSCARMGASTDDTRLPSATSTQSTSGNSLSWRACTCGSCGICWANIAVPMLNLKTKDLMDVPALVAMALQADGWWVRSKLPWLKRATMPESVQDRPTSAIEYVFLLTKGPSYFYDAEAVKQKGAIGAGVRAAKGSNVRSDLKDVNGRPPEYWEYTGTRNFRNSDLFFSSLEAPHGLLSDVDGEPLALDVNTAAFKESHFATFPVKLVDPLIRAGTSERGCCAACGAPWVRLVERKDQGWDGSRYGERAVEATGGAKSGGTARSTLGSSNGKMTGRHETTGWTPSCACRTLECSSCEGGGLGPVALAPNAPGGLAETCCEVCAGKGMLPAAPVPCTVLDPFGGAGTTGLVAQQLGRDAILLELNPEYAAMAGRRLQGDRGELPIEGVGLFAAAGQ